MEEEADVLRTPVPLLWLGGSFPFWLLLLILIGATWGILRRNRDY